MLGHEHSHFLLTISEDAMTLFNERLSTERNLVESSFGDVIYLERLGRVIATEIIQKLLFQAETGPTKKSYRNCAILWAFGGGIPREIKRNTFTCRQNSVDITTADPYEIWKLMYLGMVNSMLSVSPPKERSTRDAKYRFLILCEGLIGVARMDYGADIVERTIRDGATRLQEFVSFYVDCKAVVLGNRDTISVSAKGVIAPMRIMCRRKIEMSPGVQSRDDTPGGGEDGRGRETIFVLRSSQCI